MSQLLPPVALQEAMARIGLFTASATEEVVAREYARLLGQLARASTALEGGAAALTEAQIAAEISSGGPFAQQLAARVGGMQAFEARRAGNFVQLLNKLSPAYRAGLRGVAGAGARKGLQAGARFGVRSLAKRGGFALLAPIAGLGAALPVLLAAMTAYEAYHLYQSLRGQPAPPAQPAVSVQPISSGRAAPANSPYGVYVLRNIAGGIVYVGTEASVANAPTCAFHGGGNCSGDPAKDPKVDPERKLGPFKTQAEATKALCGAISGEPSYWTLQHTWKARVFGQDRWLTAKPNCGAGPSA